MSEQDGGYGLGVDLGTSNTVAVLRWPDGRTRPLLFDGQPIMPSGVFLDDAGRLHVGRDAQRLAQADPARYEPNPKRRIDEQVVLLGDREVPIVDLLAGLLRVVAQAAVEAVGFLPPAVLTYPATWGARRREALATAVGRAGWPPADPAATPTRTGGTLLVPEPVAAARYFAGVLRRPVPVGSAIAVYDFGGGTLDIAVVRNEGTDEYGRARFAVIGSGGLAELGGLDLDAALADHLVSLLGGADPQAVQRLTQPATATQWRDRRQFWDGVRGAKEMLSRTTVAPVAVPGVEQALHLTRDELERLATPLLRRGVFEAASVIANCQLTPDQLAGLFLVGGSSRVPLVARLLHAELGIAPTVLEQPELPVAEGALAELGAPALPPTSGLPASAPPMSAPPMSAAPMSAAPVFAALAGDDSRTMASPPVGFAPVSAVPASPGPLGAAPAPAFPAPPVGPGQSYPTTGRPPGTWRNRRTIWIGAGAVVALIAVVTAAVVYFTRGYHDIDFQGSFTDVGKPIPVEGQPRAFYTQLVGDRAYLAYELEDKRLEVIAADAKTGKELWRTQTTSRYDEWDGIRGLPNGLVAYGNESSDATERDVIFFDVKGKQRWTRKIRGDDWIFYFDEMAVVLDRTGDRLVGLSLSDGKQKWKQDNPKDESGDADTEVYLATTADDLGGPADARGVSLAPDRGDDQRLVRIGADRSAQVIDATTGRFGKRGDNVADPDDLVAVYDGKLYVASTDGGYRLDAYDLDTMDTPVALYSAANRRRAERLAPCGDGRVCLLETDNGDSKTTELVMVDVEKRRRDWHEPAPEMDLIVPVGEHIMVRDESSPYTSIIFQRNGTGLVARDEVGVRLDGGNVLMFADSLSTSEDSPSVAGIGMSSGQRHELGQLKDVRSATCSWNTAIIVCAAESAFVFRRFAKP